MYICAFVYLAGVLSSLEEAGTEHGVGDPVGVGVLTVLLGQDGQIQAVQAFQTADWVTHTHNQTGILIGTLASSSWHLQQPNHAVIFDR